MDARLEKMFSESRKRHENAKVKKEIIKQLTTDELKLEKARKLKHRYNFYDKQRFGITNDLNKEWIVQRILNSKCEYCGEEDWNKLGCDRIDNSKPHTKDNVLCACVRCNRLRGDQFSVEDMREIGEVIKKIEKRNTILKVGKKKGKKVAKLDKDGNVVKIYPSIIETAVDGYNRNCVGKACNFRYNGGTNIYSNYYWEFL